jgi:hypothetical protein
MSTARSIPLFHHFALFERCFVPAIAGPVHAFHRGRE